MQFLYIHIIFFCVYRLLILERFVSHVKYHSFDTYIYIYIYTKVDRKTVYIICKII